MTEDKVRRLKAVEREPNPQLVKFAERLLKDVKDGTIVSIIYVAETPMGAPISGSCIMEAVNGHNLISALEIEKLLLINQTLRVVDRDDPDDD